MAREEDGAPVGGGAPPWHSGCVALAFPLSHPSLSGSQGAVCAEHSVQSGVRGPSQQRPAEKLLKLESSPSNKQEFQPYSCSSQSLGVYYHLSLIITTKLSANAANSGFR